jgi:tryptophan synthase alpha chain
MSRLKAIFKDLAQNNKTALIPYITAGDSSLAMTAKLMHKFVEEGANIIELGVPFSDPMADGPVIQAAHERALLNHVSVKDVLALVAKFRKNNNKTGIVLMGYLNPIEKMGYENFAQEASKAGVDAILTVDLPPEESDEFYTSMNNNEIDCIFLVAPTTTSTRIELIKNKASGFIYYVSLKGVTGSSNLNIDEVTKKCKQIKQATNLPIGVGFGIKDAKSAKAVSKISDAVIVGSALINKIASNLDNEEKAIQETGNLIKELRQALDY